MSLPYNATTQTTTVHIRAAQVDDAREACEVLRRSIAELCETDHGNDEAVLARWLANKTPENMVSWISKSHVFVSEENGQIIGVAALTGSGHITLNYVLPEARFRGVSKALLHAMENKAAEFGCRACTLESTRTAERFYRAAGYSERSDLPEGLLAKVLPNLQAKR